MPAWPDTFANVPISLGMNAASGLITSFIEPAFHLSGQEGNRRVSVQLPPIQLLMAALAKGTISQEAARFALQSAGVPLMTRGEKHDGGLRNDAWLGCFEATLQFYSPEHIVQMWLRGLLTRKQFEEAYRRAGGTVPFDRLARQANRGLLDFATIGTMFNRGWFTEDQAKAELQRTTAIEGDLNYLLRFLWEKAPPPDDLIRFAMREVFNPALANQLHLLDEFADNPQFVTFCQGQGIGDYKVRDNNGQIQTLNLPQAYWMAHWQLPSNGEGYQMLHRLRPERINLFQQLIPGVKPFTIDDLNTLLKVNDIAPAYRKQLAAISHTVLRIYDVRNAYYQEVIDLDEAIAQYRDRGYNQHDADIAGKLLQKTKKDRDDAKKEKDALHKYGKTIRGIANAYKLGSVSYTAAFQKIVSFGLDSQLAGDMLDAIDITVSAGIVKSYIAAVKTEYFLGLYNQPGCVAELVAGGVNPPRANQLAMLWTRQLSRPRRVAATNTIVDWLKRGLITYGDAESRLRILGWSAVDTLMYMGQATQDIEKERIRQQLATARDEKARQREIDRLIEKSKREVREYRAELMTHTSPPMMALWLGDGTIDVSTVIERLHQLGWPDDDIERWFDHVGGPATPA